MKTRGKVFESYGCISVSEAVDFIRGLFGADRLFLLLVNEVSKAKSENDYDVADLCELDYY